jgi:hypothetical protein
MTRRDQWKLKLCLLRFIREASPDTLLTVAELAATLMTKAHSYETPRGHS